MFGVCIYEQHLFGVVKNQTSNKIYQLELIKRKKKVHEKKMSREGVLNFDQRQIFSENYKPITVLLYFAYKISREQLSLATFRLVH